MHEKKKRMLEKRLLGKSPISGITMDSPSKTRKYVHVSSIPFTRSDGDLLYIRHSFREEAKQNTAPDLNKLTVN